ncbi:MAG: hypothetical protein JWR55_1285 [Aeromicrobium sp.]|nr:hypothetical protein [Aeromicrobium sp.]
MSVLEQRSAPPSTNAEADGLSSWTVLAPQAPEGAATVALLYATVRRSTASAGAALLAGAIVAEIAAPSAANPRVTALRFAATRPWIYRRSTPGGAA